jgi:hypothetical protein
VEFADFAVIRSNQLELVRETVFLLGPVGSCTVGSCKVV